MIHWVQWRLYALPEDRGSWCRISVFSSGVNFISNPSSHKLQGIIVFSVHHHEMLSANHPSSRLPASDDCIMFQPISGMNRNPSEALRPFLEVPPFPSLWPLQKSASSTFRPYWCNKWAKLISFQTYFPNFSTALTLFSILPKSSICALWKLGGFQIESLQEKIESSKVWAISHIYTHSIHLGIMH